MNETRCKMKDKHFTHNNGITTSNVEHVLDFGTEIEHIYLREKQNNTQQQQRFDHGMKSKQILDGSKNLLLSNINKNLWFKHVIVRTKPHAKKLR